MPLDKRVDYSHVLLLLKRLLIRFLLQKLLEYCHLDIRDIYRRDKFHDYNIKDDFEGTLKMIMTKAFP